MEYAYLAVVIFISVFMALSVYLIFKNLVRKPFSKSKYNLSKKFLTTCYSQILGLKKLDKDESYVLAEFLKLLQRLFEARFVVHFRESKNKYVFVNSTEPFFPYIAGISKLRKIFSEKDLPMIISNKHLVAMHYDNNRHRIIVISDTSIIEDKEVKEVLKEINSNVIVIVPTYKQNHLDNIFLVFSNYYYISDEVEIITNLLIDYVSLLNQFLTNRQTLENILSYVAKGIPLESFSIGSHYKIIVDPRKMEVVSSDAFDELNQEILSTIKEMRNKGFDFDKRVSMLKNIILNGNESLLYLRSDSSHDLVKVQVSLVSIGHFKDTSKLLEEIVNKLPIPCILFNSSTKEIKAINEKFNEVFPESNKYSDIEDFLNNQSYISPGRILVNGQVFETKELDIGETNMRIKVFYPIQIVDQRVAMEVYKEIIKVRKYMASINFLESVMKSKNVESYVKYQPSDALVEVGGDFFVLKDLDKKTFIAIFDVMGHNLSSGFLAVNVKIFLERALSQGKDIVRIAEELNNFIFDLNESTLYEVETYSYITGLLCEINLEKMKLRIVSGGHKYGVLLKEDSIKQFQDILQSSKPFGISQNTKFIANEIPISPQDKVFLFTDGIVEVEKQDGSGRIIDQAKIIDLIVFCRNLSVREIIEEIFSYIKGLKETKVRDDFIILGFKIKE